MNVRATPLLVRRLVALGIMLGLWEALARLGVINPFYLPPPSKVAATLFTLFEDGEIWTHIEATFYAALLGLALGVIVGAVLGAAAALLPYVGEILDPVMTVLNAVPRIILAPLFVIWFGTGTMTRIFIAMVISFFPMVVNAIRGIQSNHVCAQNGPNPR
jgi:NitT/TauT family transport system permease protein